MTLPGEMRKLWTVVCGRCQAIDQPPGETYRECCRHLRIVGGWRLTKRHGWLCGYCIAEHKASPKRDR